MFCVISAALNTCLILVVNCWLLELVISLNAGAKVEEVAELEVLEAISDVLMVTGLVLVKILSTLLDAT